ncbi:MAG: hypothetical protein OXF64_00695 [bacterium]|nr:hypothetical protein [bacterium]MCY4193361.1 hypothetical protein [bacterium]MCY4273344.1 hypothetical protein [bacterium]
MDSWETLLDEVEAEVIDVESVLAELDDLDLDALRVRVQAATADGSIARRPVIQRCAELTRSRTD